MSSPLVNYGKFPKISLPSETVFTIGPLPVTNTLIVTVIADIVLILFALRATRKVRKGSPDAEIPRGAQNIFELIIDMLYGLSKSVAGSKAVKIFPWMATIFLFVLFANWTELFPGIESIGFIEPAHEGIGYPKVETDSRRALHRRSISAHRGEPGHCVACGRIGGGGSRKAAGG